MVFAREAGAQGNEETSVPLASQGQTVGRTSERVLVTLKVHSEGPQVTEESLRLAIANELGTTVVLGETDTVASNGRAVIVAYDPSRRELAVSVRSSGRANTT